jgi:hypothetical protein
MPRWREQVDAWGCIVEELNEFTAMTHFDYGEALHPVSY